MSFIQGIRRAVYLLLWRGVVACGEQMPAEAQANEERVGIKKGLSTGTRLVV
jgi:hypothetical protein